MKPFDPSKPLCPTCRGKCTTKEVICDDRQILMLEYYPLPQPDLTNLREVWKVFIQNTDINKQNKLSFQDGGKLIFNVLQAVKELLEQE